MNIPHTFMERLPHSCYSATLETYTEMLKTCSWSGRLGGSVVEHLPLAQVVILGSSDRVCIRLPAGSLLLPLPVSLPLSLCLS